MGLHTAPQDSCGGPDRDVADFERLRHGRAQHAGFSVGRYLQPAPMLFTRDGHNVFLGDMYRGKSAFLLCAGPSLATHDLDKLRSRGVLTMAVNNAAAVHRPNLWCSVDDPGNFCDAIWRDPGILKFVPLCHMEKGFTVRNEAGELLPSLERVGDMPAVFGFRRNESFDAEQWLFEDTFNWGNHSDRVDALGNRGSRSVMYIALRLLFFLGVRRVYLVGCDFRMEVGKQNYAFPQARTGASVRGNNSTYAVLNARLEQLRPHFEREGFEIYNCTPESGLQVFPHLDFETALTHMTADVPQSLNTEGMYDRGQRERDAERTAMSERCGALAAARPGRPDTTLVLGLDESNVRCLPHTWQTWRRFQPWLTELPRIVVHTSGVSPEQIPGEVREGSVLLETSSPPGQALAESALWQAAEQSDSRWLLTLAPTAVATEQSCWPLAEWFEGDEGEDGPVCVAAQWGYAKPADVFARLDAWGDSLECLREFPALNLPLRADSDRIEYAGISRWCCFVRRDHVLRVAGLLASHAAGTDFHALLWYVATRRNEGVVRVPMKDFGWEHSFSHSIGQVIARALDVLQAPDDGLAVTQEQEEVRA